MTTPKPLHELGILVNNYKCFDSKNESQGIFKLAPLVVVAGKNNSGKSALLDAIEVAFNGNFNSSDKDQVERHKQLRRQDNILLIWHISDGERAKIRNKTPQSPNVIAKSSEFYVTWPRVSLQSVNGDEQFTSRMKKHSEYNKIPSWLNATLKSFWSFRIAAERDILPEAHSTDEHPTVSVHGDNATSLVQKYLHSRHLDRDQVKTKVLQDLNQLFEPDGVEFTDLRAMIEDNNWELHLTEERKGHIPLSSSGSGLKTIILCLIAVHLLPLPAIPNVTRRLFIIEEPENNLHPSMQRRLLQLLHGYSRTRATSFVISTHSATIVDVAAALGNSRIVHVQAKPGRGSFVHPVSSYALRRNILDDLGARASDLLQANGIVWVEGPSDRIYFNKWIELASAQDGGAHLHEGIHYQCAFTNGTILKHASGDDPEVPTQDQVLMLRVNRNAMLMADRDKDDGETELEPDVLRLINELGDDAWVTKGREVENYIPKSVLRTIYGEVETPGQFDKVWEWASEKGRLPLEGRKPDGKVALARRVVKLLKPEHLDTLDLAEQLRKAVARIRKWNGLESPDASSTPEDPE